MAARRSSILPTQPLSRGLENKLKSTLLVYLLVLCEGGMVEGRGGGGLLLGQC